MKTWLLFLQRFILLYEAWFSGRFYCIRILLVVKSDETVDFSYLLFGSLRKIVLSYVILNFTHFISDWLFPTLNFSIYLQGLSLSFQQWRKFSLHFLRLEVNRIVFHLAAVAKIIEKISKIHLLLLFLRLTYPISIHGVILIDTFCFLDRLSVNVRVRLQNLLYGVELRPLVFAETANDLQFHIITVKNYRCI